MPLMPTVEEVAHLIFDGVNPDTLQYFKIEDIFNPPNILEGWLCRQSDHRYGSIYIYTVNGVLNPQFIFVTPKLHYPFGRTENEERKYHFRPIKAIEVYEKLDGTNICAYTYTDATGSRFITYKTRLTPVVQNNRFAPFISLWNELLTSQLQLQAFITLELETHPYTSLSFEMFGYKNPHTIVYKQPLFANLLFGVQGDATIVTPSYYLARYPLANSIFLTPVVTGTAKTKQELIELYENFRSQAESINVTKEEEKGAAMVEGTEGYVFYTLDTKDRWTQWKCKPPSIEELHWASEFIPMGVIMATVWNSLESMPSDYPSVEYTKELLLEEFTPLQITASTNRIEKAVEYVVNRMLWREKVLTAYNACGLSLETHGKDVVMREMAKRFERGQMREVFNALRELGLVK